MSRNSRPAIGTTCTTAPRDVCGTASNTAGSSATCGRARAERPTRAAWRREPTICSSLLSATTSRNPAVSPNAKGQSSQTAPHFLAGDQAVPLLNLRFACRLERDPVDSSPRRKNISKLLRIRSALLLSLLNQLQRCFWFRRGRHPENPRNIRRRKLSVFTQRNHRHKRLQRKLLCEVRSIAVQRQDSQRVIIHQSAHKLR